MADRPTPHMQILAALALEHTVAQEWEEAAAIVGDIAEQYMWTGMFTAMLSWAQMLVGEAEFPEAADVNVVLVNASTGRAGSDGAPPEILWAREFLVARAAGDDIKAQELLVSAGCDPDFLRATALAVLNCVGTTIAKARAERGRRRGR